jgi:hypothetical protein
MPVHLRLLHPSPCIDPLAVRLTTTRRQTSQPVRIGTWLKRQSRGPDGSDPRCGAWTAQPAIVQQREGGGSIRVKTVICTCHGCLQVAQQTVPSSASLQPVGVMQTHACVQTAPYIMLSPWTASSPQVSASSQQTRQARWSLQRRREVSRQVHVQCCNNAAYWVVDLSSSVKAWAWRVTKGPAAVS